MCWLDFGVKGQGHSRRRQRSTAACGVTFSFCAAQLLVAECWEPWMNHALGRLSRLSVNAACHWSTQHHQCQSDADADPVIARRQTRSCCALDWGQTRGEEEEGVAENERVQSGKWSVDFMLWPCDTIWYPASIPWLGWPGTWPCFFVNNYSP